LIVTASASATFIEMLPRFGAFPAGLPIPVGTNAIPAFINRYNLDVGPDSEVSDTSGIFRSPAGPAIRGNAVSFREPSSSDLWKRGACLLVLLCGAACTAPPAIRQGGPRPLHDFLLTEEYRGQIRKIDVHFEPGHALQWELIRSDDPERNKSPLTDLDYGETPAPMDQSFPLGFAERPEEGQILSITLEYAAEGNPDSLVRSHLTRWYQKKKHAFSELSEGEAEAEEHSRKAHLEERR
jgi:hypothetical protein